MPRTNAAPATPTATAASVLWVCVMRAATSATMTAAVASSPGVRAIATAESANENAQRNPATRSARRAAGIALTSPGRVLSRADRTDESDDGCANGLDSFSSRPSCTGSAAPRERLLRPHYPTDRVQHGPPTTRPTRGRPSGS